MNYATAATANLLTKKEAAELRRATRQLEKKWDFFGRGPDNENLGARIKYGHIDTAMALARTAPCVIEEDDEVLGLFPCHPNYFRWVLVYVDEGYIDTGEEPASRWDDWRDETMPAFNGDD